MLALRAARFRFAPVSLVACLLMASYRCACAQYAQDTRPTPQFPTSSTASGRDEDAFRDTGLQEKLRRTREKDRQKRIVDDANRLVELTAQYRKQVASHAAPTPEDQKLLLDIEKLAREVKDRMRGN